MLKEFKCSMTIHITSIKTQISKFCKMLDSHATPVRYDRTTPFPCCSIYLTLNQVLFSLLLSQHTSLVLLFIMSPKITERELEENGILNSIIILPAERHTFHLLKWQCYQAQHKYAVWGKRRAWINHFKGILK